MVERQLRRRGISDERVLRAMAEVPRELFVGAAQAREVGAQRLDLVLQVQQAAPQRGVFLVRAPQVFGHALALLLHALAQLQDGTAGLVVLEQGRLRGSGEERSGGQGRCEHGTVDGFHR